METTGAKQTTDLMLKTGSELQLLHQNLGPLADAIEKLGLYVLCGLIAVGVAIVIHGALKRKNP
jgi:hypothetical protein